MKKDGYKNSVLHQVCDLKELAEIQREKCFDLDKLSGIMEAKACAGVKRVILARRLTLWISATIIPGRRF